MHITKQTLRIGVAALAMAIGSQALAALPLAESFEEGANGSLVTNLPTSAWSSTGGDLSVITNLTYGYTATSLPLTNPVTHTKVAQLATEGGMLSFTNGAPNDLTTGGNLYVDAMVKFVISDSDPTASSITNDTKIALFANSSSNLVIRHKMETNGWELGAWELKSVGITNAVTTTIINPDDWYRVTIRLRRSAFKDPTGDDPLTEITRTYGEVQLNGVTITNLATAYSNTLFFSCTDVDEQSLNAVSFMGTGFIDDVVVTRDVPSFVFTASVFSYVIEERTNGVFVAYIPVTAPSAWSKEYDPPSSAWFTNKLDSGTDEMFTLGADGRTVASPVPDGDNNNTTNLLKVLLDQAKTAEQLPTQFATLSEDEIEWIRGFGKTPDETLDSDANTPAFEQAMDLDPYVNETVTAEITSFTVGDPNSTIVVKALTNGVPYEASGLSVRILTDAKDDLADAWTLGVATNNVDEFNGDGEATATVATPAGNFFKVRLVEQP